ncbi:MAG TPA: hypothetical protein VMS08_03655 [Candidatus Saccharimonadia bacterium]|nr:hypothetical protein [Candidatus Saccharimonadia bacterium]
MAVVYRETVILEVRARRWTPFLKALYRILGAVDGRIKVIESRRLSTELRDQLGIPDSLNQQLTGLGLTTPAKLREKSERVLRRLGISWHGIQIINLKLAAEPSRRMLRGYKVEPSDMIERLDLASSRYALLKEAGYNAISQLTQLDKLGLMILTHGSADVVTALAKAQRRPAPLDMGRTVAELMSPAWSADEITGRGFDPAIVLRDLSVTGIRTYFDDPEGANVGTTYWTTLVGHYLELYGGSLPY